MGDLGQQRAQRDDHASVGLPGDRDDLVAEGAPPQLRFAAQQRDQVGADTIAAHRAELGERPLDAACGAVFDVHDRAGAGEVVELFGIDGGKRNGAQPIA